MIVDVMWDGVPLARGTQAREQSGGWFVELEQPMPVGTTLVLGGEVQATVQVERVHEGVGAGMLVQTTAAKREAPKAAADKAEANKAEADKKDAARPEADKGDGEPDKDDDGGNKGGRRRRKRTMMGH